MPAINDALKSHLSTDREITITVTGRKTGRAIPVLVWFALDDSTLWLLPVNGSDTQWYHNVLKSPSIRINAGRSQADFQGVPVTDPTQVSAVVEKFRDKYGDSGLKYYSKLDVAVLARAR